MSHPTNTKIAFAALLLCGLMSAVAIIQGCASSGSYKEMTGARQPSELRTPGTQTVTPPGVFALERGWADPTPRIPLVPAQSRPLPQEELWIIQKPIEPTAGQPAGKPPIPGSGVLVTTAPGSTQIVPIPLKHTDVHAAITGYIATVSVQQQFQNPYDGKIEATYVFPLPESAAVNEFVMTVGDRTIRGIIREREQARQLYEQARAQGYVAALLTQERPNIFTQRVANIEPGKQINVDIKYFHTLPYRDGAYEFAFPMVVGPRFNPPESLSGIGAGTQDQPGASGQKTEVAYLRPDQRSGHDLSLDVAVDAGVKIEQIECASHAAKIVRDGANTAQVRLAAADHIANKDFVLRYKVGGADVKARLVATRDVNGQGGYFALMLFPPADVLDLPWQPLEMIFTLDVSGSMSGQPMEQCRAAMRYALSHMRPEDTLQVVRFATTTEQLSPRPVPATPQNTQAAWAYVQNAQAGGGTMMLDGISRSLEGPRDDSRMRVVAFLTDGYIGNENEIFTALAQVIGSARVFSFGVGQAPNRYLLDEIAKLGRGAVAYLSLNDNADSIMAAYFDRLSHPALTNLSLDLGVMGAADVLPASLPDLFVGRPLLITGRYTAELPQFVAVEGRVGGQTRRIIVPVTEDRACGPAQALPAIWARMKISDLCRQAMIDPTFNFQAPIKELAMRYNLLSEFTAFVSVDSMTRTAGNFGTTVGVPVPVPEGARYETTVPSENASDTFHGM